MERPKSSGNFRQVDEKNAEELLNSLRETEAGKEWQELERKERLHLDVDTRLKEMWTDAPQWVQEHCDRFYQERKLRFTSEEKRAMLLELALQLFGEGMRTGYGQGYNDALTEEKPGQLFSDHGYTLPERRKPQERL